MACNKTCIRSTKDIESALEETIKNFLQTPAVLENLATAPSGLMFKQFKEKLASMDARIATLEKELAERDFKIQQLEYKQQMQEQYTRRNCLRVFGVPESRNEKIDEVVANYFKPNLIFRYRMMLLTTSLNQQILSRITSQKNIKRRIKCLQDDVLSRQKKTGISSKAVLLQKRLCNKKTTNR